MSATTQPRNFSDLYLDLLQRVRQDRNSSATAEQAKRYINTALYDMHIGLAEKFPWAERSATLVTHPTVSATTTSSLSHGALGITIDVDPTALNGFGQANMRVGGKVRPAGQREWYEINSTTALLAIGWTSAYVSTEYTLPSTTTLTYFEDEYDLAADFGRPIDLTRFTDGPNPVELVGRSRFRRAVEGRFEFGRPTAATIIDRPPIGNTTPRRRVRLWPIPDSALQLTYSYVTTNLVVSSAGVAAAQFSSDDDEPIVPVRYRHAIVLHALYHWYRDKKDDDRSQEARAEYIDLVSRIAGDSEIGSEKASIAPRTTPYRTRSRRPWRGGLGRYDVTGAFDRLEDL